ncbi:MAG: hypothetical protein PHN64_04615 [Desulfovibrionaceae bacterium]|nr:hypothetical protein [Desulfovibrionaceae bacterium]
MIEGLNVRCNVGAVQVLRSPFIELVYRRRAVLSRAVVSIPDPFGEVRAALAPQQAVTVRFGYRGEATLWHEWQGTVESIDQPSAGSADQDAVTVRAVGLEKALATTMITESFYREPADAVARRLLARTGLAVGAVDVPADILPHQVFSHVSVARALKQLSQTLETSFGHDMSRHALWLGAQGLTWSDADEAGEVYSIATAENLIAHSPPAREGELGSVVAVLLPGLTDSRQVHIRDVRRGIDVNARAQDVIHTLSAAGNVTTISYGADAGWG